MIGKLVITTEKYSKLLISKKLFIGIIMQDKYELAYRIHWFNVGLSVRARDGAPSVYPYKKYFDEGYFRIL